MNKNLSIQGDEVDPKMSPLVDAHDPLLPDIRGEGEILRQPPTQWPQEYYRDYESIVDSDGPLVLPLYHTA